MVLGDAVSKLETFVWIKNHISNGLGDIELATLEFHKVALKFAKGTI